MIGRTVAGIYEIREQLGSGGGGVVYRAWNIRLQKDVVLKALRGGTAASLATQEKEKEILKNLKHQYLPTLYDFVVEEEQVYTVIDFVPGQSFDRLLREGGHYPQQQVIRWATQLCEALCYLHAQTPPILHSDVKPANVMLTPAGDVCLIDFNISLMMGDDGAVSVGRSHGYASPEQYGEAGPPLTQGAAADPAATVLLTNATQMDAPGPGPNPARAQAVSYSTGTGRMRMDVRSDVYSLGATLYHLLTGERPAASPAETKPLSSFGLGLGEAVVYIVEKAMAADPAARFQTADQMLHALRGIQKVDRRWKNQVLRRNLAAILLILLFAGGAVSTAVGLGSLAREKEERYADLVYQAGSSEGEAMEVAFLDALELFPHRVDAFQAKARVLAQAGEYEQARGFIQQSVPLIQVPAGDEAARGRLGDLYFILGNTYFEEEDYGNAVLQYRAALDYNERNPEYYRDYAIALARSGEVEAAESMVLTAEKQGLGNDSIDLLRGEIAFAKGDDAEAIARFESSLRTAEDDYIRYRAVRISSDVYKRTGRFDEEIGLLEATIPALPASYANELLERMADAYVRGAQSGLVDEKSYYRQAANCFEVLLGRGYRTFILQQNLAIVYQQMGDFESAQEVLWTLEADYPQDYRVPMRLAYLFADYQSTLPNEQRDYGDAKASFERAWALYQEQLAPGTSDPEMLMLQELMNQLAQGGWF